MDLDLSGKHALVCGASEGIGRATAHELALLGADVTVLARRADALQALVAELPRKESQAHGYISADVLDTDRLHAQAQALANGKPVHILVNNTGGPPGGPAHAADAASFERAFRQHLLANQALVQSVLPGMQAAHFGRIVNNVLPGYTRTQRLDQILHDRAQATGKPEAAIADGMLATVPAGRFAEASELAAVIAFLCSPAAGYVNGINVPVDGGRTKSL